MNEPQEAATEKENHEVVDNNVSKDVKLQDETTINKSYVLQQLIKLLEANKEPNQNTPSDNDEADVIEACCFLWDVTVNPELSLFLYENHSIEVLLQTITTIHSTRLKEVCIGTLANMASSPEISRDLTDAPDKINKIIVPLSDEQPAVLVEIFRLYLAILSQDQIPKNLVLLLSETDVLCRIIFIFASTMDETLCSRASKVLTKLCWISTEICDKMVKELDFVTIIAEVLADKSGKNYQKNSFNHCSDLLEAILDLVEFLSSKQICFPKLCQSSISSILKKIIKEKKNIENISLISSACLSLANIEMENENSILAKDNDLVKYLILHLDFNKIDETLAIYAVLNEVSDQLKKSPHLQTCMTIATNIEKILDPMTRAQQEEYMFQFLENFLYIASLLGDKPPSEIPQACLKIEQFFKDVSY